LRPGNLETISGKTCERYGKLYGKSGVIGYVRELWGNKGGLTNMGIQPRNNSWRITSEIAIK